MEAPGKGIKPVCPGRRPARDRLRPTGRPAVFLNRIPRVESIPSLTLKSSAVGDDTTAGDSSKSSGRCRRRPEFFFTRPGQTVFRERLRVPGTRPERELSQLAAATQRPKGSRGFPKPLTIADALRFGTNCAPGRRNARLHPMECERSPLAARGRPGDRRKIGTFLGGVAAAGEEPPARRGQYQDAPVFTRLKISS